MGAWVILLIFLFGAASNFLAWKKGFYRLPPPGAALTPPLRFHQVLLLFGLNFGGALLPFLLLVRLFPESPQRNAILQALALLLPLLALFLYSATLNRKMIKTIWKEDEHWSLHSVFKDLLLGALCWLLVFPLFSAIGKLLELFARYLFGVFEYEQIAIRFLKEAMGSPSQLLFALFIIIVVAPVTEEYLFRGILQQWIKAKLGRKAAILLSSFIFTLFHLAPSQKEGNIIIGFSLFFFACFLGFLYEKTKSLFSSVGLHAIFNAITAIQILLAI